MAEKQVPSLEGLIQPKGAARPDAVAQRGEVPALMPTAEPTSPARVLQSSLRASMAPPCPAPAEREPRAKSLTLRLSEAQYERLRRFAFDHRLSHQDILERAMVEFLDRHERGG
jgi:hypothetical protein